MSKYTTGELASLCDVSVRTVQYYDERGILVPTALSEGGRRLYSEEDVKRLRIICFLRDMGIGIDQIKRLLSEAHPEEVLALLLDEQEKALRAERKSTEEKLARIAGLRRELESATQFSVESIGDIAYVMENKKKMRRLHLVLLLMGIPMMLLEWGTAILWVLTGVFWPFIATMCLMIPYGIWVSIYYFRRAAYICPACHGIFRPRFKEAFFARHTPTLRYLSCPFCGHRGYCVETYTPENEKGGSHDNV